MTEINEIRQQLRQEYGKINGESDVPLESPAMYADWLEAKLAALILETSKNKTNAQTTPKTSVPVND
jgi:hypothetical protein